MNPTLENFHYDDAIVILPLALLVVGAAVAAFTWAARSGQFDDTDTPPQRMLVDDAAPRTRDQAARERSGGDSGVAR